MILYAHLNEHLISSYSDSQMSSKLQSENAETIESTEQKPKATTKAKFICGTKHRWEQTFL